MPNFFSKFINLIFYSNFWIAACATAMVLQTRFLISHKLNWSPVVGLVFFGTLFLYALHRIVGLYKVQKFTDRGRFKIISKFKSHIILYAVLAALGAGFFFLKTTWAVRWAVIIPAIVSMAYVLPILKNKKRLRDVGIIKIFLIAFVWAWVTVGLPASEMNEIGNPAMWIMSLERALFIFAITLPFDIRDLKVDAHTTVHTIPAKIGIRNTKRLAGLTLIAMLAMSFLNFKIGFYSFSVFGALIVSAVSTFVIILFSDKTRHDYYFTGLLDGTMMIQFLLVWIASGI